MPDRGRQVVFAEARRQQLQPQLAPPLPLLIRKRMRGQKHLQIGGLRGVVIQPPLIHHPRHRRHQRSPQAHGAQKAILERPAGNRKGSPRPAPHHSLRRGRPALPPTGAKPQLASSRGPQKAASKRPLPRREPACHQQRRLAQQHLPLQHQVLHHLLHRCRRTRHRIAVTAVLHQAGMGHLLHGSARLSPGRLHAAIVGQTPTGIKRLPKAVHRLVPEQGFKSKLGCDHIHRLGLLQQSGGVAPISAHHHTRILKKLGLKVPPAPARHHIGMDLHHHPMPRMLIQGCPQSLREGRSGAPRPAQREIPLALIHHQHEGFLRNRRFPGAVVLRQPRLPPVLHQGARALPLGPIQRLGNQDIQLGWLAGVVIDAPRIQHQPQRGLLSP